MHVIYDCDGVLVDSELLNLEAWQSLLARDFGLAVATSELHPLVGLAARDVVRHFEGRFGRTFPAEIAARKDAVYEELARGRLKAMPRIHEALALLRAAGIPFALATSARPEKRDFTLRQTGLDSHFSITCSSVEVERGKPAPDLFLLAAQRLGAEPATCVVVEDSVFGIEGALRAGMRVVGYPSSHSEARLREAGAHVVIGDHVGIAHHLVSLQMGEPQVSQSSASR